MQLKKIRTSLKLLLIVVLIHFNGSAQCPVVAPVPNNACYQQVIANDSWCCNNSWDGICQAAYDNCNIAPPPCAVVAPVPNDACYQQVIANDSWCCNNSWDALCQSAYDACNPSPSGPCASITSITGCGTSVSANMSGTGVGWNINACGYSTLGTEMIFSFTATASGIHSIDVTGISGGYIDFFWVDATSGCSSGAPWNCISDISTTGNYGSMNWTAGNTYYILLDPEGTGSYSVTFDVDCPNPGGPITASDCATRTPVCTNLSFQIDPNGYGLVDELCVGCTANPFVNPASANDGCLQNGELNSTWFEVNVANGGTLEFSFGSAGAGNCYDWIMWDLGPTTCTDIVNGTQAPVRCNWNFPCDGFTGMGPVPAGGFTGNFEPTLNVNTGDQFVICFSNYSSALTTVPLNFTGTADISCNTLPLPVGLIEFKGEDLGGYNLLTWKTGAEINNDKFEVERSSDGVHFELIGTLDGAGTTTEMSTYAFTDINPERSITYYRLRQVDFNGSFEYSAVITVVQNDNNEMKIASAYPNPAEDILNIELVVPKSEEVTLTVSEPSGKLIETYTQICNTGGNLIKIPVQNLSSGLYVLRVLNLNTNESEIIRFTVK